MRECQMELPDADFEHSQSFALRLQYSHGSGEDHLTDYQRTVGPNMLILM